MIELRWLERPGTMTTGTLDANGNIVEQHDEPFGTERVLQYRRFSDSALGYGWSDWQDVPVVKEGGER